MLNFLVTLKQKDLSAVSAEQILKQSPIKIDNQNVYPKSIARYQIYEIQFTNTSITNDLLKTIEESYIFSNPNKHTLITSNNSDHLCKKSHYFKISRQVPVHLSEKEQKLHSVSSSFNITSIYLSDLWAIKLSDPINSDDVSLLMDHWITSDKNNFGLFSHPLIHTVNYMSHSQIQHLLNA